MESQQHESLSDGSEPTVVYTQYNEDGASTRIETLVGELATVLTDFGGEKQLVAYEYQNGKLSRLTSYTGASSKPCVSMATCPRPP